MVDTGSRMCTHDSNALCAVRCVAAAAAPAPPDRRDAGHPHADPARRRLCTDRVVDTRPVRGLGRARSDRGRARTFLPSPAAVGRPAWRWPGPGSCSPTLGHGAARAARVRARGAGLGAARHRDGHLQAGQAAFEPMIGLLRYLPASAFVPLLIIWLGIDEASKIAILFIGTVFFNTLMTADVVRGVPRALIDVSYTMGARRGEVLRKVIVPHALPGIIDAIRVNAAAAWNLVVVAELDRLDGRAGLPDRARAAVPADRPDLRRPRRHRHDWCVCSTSPCACCAAGWGDGSGDRHARVARRGKDFLSTAAAPACSTRSTCRSHQVSSSVSSAPAARGSRRCCRSIAGLSLPTEGEILLDGKAVTGPGPDRGLVFQTKSLFPWRTVLRNVAFGLELLRLSKASGTPGRWYLAEVGLTDFGHALPRQFSGGQQQRVALARALAWNRRSCYSTSRSARSTSRPKRTCRSSSAGLAGHRHDRPDGDPRRRGSSLPGRTVIVLSNDPGRVVAETEVDLPFDRDLTLKRSPVPRHARHDRRSRARPSRQHQQNAGRADPAGVGPEGGGNESADDATVAILAGRRRAAGRLARGAPDGVRVPTLVDLD